MTGPTSPLLEPNSKAFIDPSLGTPGLAARETAIDATIDLNESVQAQNQNYGSITEDIEAQPATEEAEEASELAPAKVRVIIASLYIGSFLAALDTTVVTTLLSSIGSDINALSKSSWIATSYLLSCASFQPLYGKLSDIFGRKPLLVFCNFCFALGCIITGLSHTLVGISIGRFICGIGGGGLTSLGTITTSDIVPLRKRGVYQGLGNIAFGLGAAIGGIWGALFDETLGWQWAFFSQVPIALVSGFLIWKNLELPKGSAGLGVAGSKSEKLKQVDFLGASLLVTSLLSFMVLVSFLGHEIVAYSVSFWFLIALSIVTIFAFGYVELYIAVQPVIPVRLLTYRTVLSSSLVNWLMAMSVYTYLFYVPVFWASALQLTPTEIGLRTISNFVGVSIGSFSAGFYMKQTGKYLGLYIISGFITVVGVYTIYAQNRGTPLWYQYLVLFIPGAGYAAILTVTLLALIAAVPYDQQAATTSIQYAFRATGSTVGVSAASYIFQRYLLEQLTEKVLAVDSPFTKKELAEIIQKAFNSSDYTWRAPEVLREAIVQSYDFATHRALLFSLITMAVAWAIGFWIQEHHLHSTIKRN